MKVTRTFLWVMVGALALQSTPTEVQADGRGRWQQPSGVFPNQRTQEWKSSWGSDYADPTADFLPARDPEWRPEARTWTRLGPEFRLGFGYGANVNRVDGASVLLSQDLVNDKWGPSFSFYEAYGFASEEWSGAAEARLGSDGFALGARWADETVSWDQPRHPVTSLENIFAATFIRRDYMDYYRRESRTYFAEWLDGDQHGLTVAYRDENHQSADRSISEFGVFGGDRRFRENPNIEAGDWNVLQARAHLSEGSEPSIWGADTGSSLLVDAQWAGGDLGDGRHFMRVWGEYRGQLRVSSHQQVSLRVSAGGAPQGDADATGSRLPRQWQFQAGGIGTLRGHEWQEFRGDRVLLATVEYGVDFDTSVRPVLFLDSGKAWNENDNQTEGIAGSGRLALDGGVGFLLGSDGFRIDLARDIRSRRAPVRVTVRLSHAI